MLQQKVASFISPKATVYKWEIFRIPRAPKKTVKPAAISIEDNQENMHMVIVKSRLKKFMLICYNAAACKTCHKISKIQTWPNWSIVIPSNNNKNNIDDQYRGGM